MLRTAVQVRLEHHEHAPGTRVGKGEQRRLDFHGMMGIVVHHRDALYPVQHLETSLQSPVCRQGRHGPLDGYFEIIGHADGRQGVEQVALARLRQYQSTGRNIPHVHLGGNAPTLRYHLVGPDTGMPGKPIGDQPAPQRSTYSAYARVVRAHEYRPVHGHEMGEGDEGFITGLLRTVVLQVVSIYRSDHGYLRGQGMERSIVFIGFHDHPGAASTPHVGSVFRHDPAYCGGRVQAGGGEHPDDHGRRRSLSVGARHGDALRPAHQRAEQVRAGDGKLAPPAGGRELGIVRRYGGRVYDQIGPRRVIGLVAAEDGSAENAKTFRQRRTPEIRPAYFVSVIKHQLTQSAHSDSADTDEMHAAACKQRLTPVSHTGVSVDGRSFWKYSAGSLCSSCRTAARNLRNSERGAAAP